MSERGLGELRAAAPAIARTAPNEPEFRASTLSGGEQIRSHSQPDCYLLASEPHRSERNR